MIVCEKMSMDKSSKIPEKTLGKITDKTAGKKEIFTKEKPMEQELLELDDNEYYLLVTSQTY